MGESIVTLRDLSDEGGTRRLDARIEGGDLLIHGVDAGDGVEAVFGTGNREYEWIWRVAAADLPRLSEALGGEEDQLLVALRKRFSGAASADLGSFLDETDLTVVRWSRLGD